MSDPMWLDYGKPVGNHPTGPGRCAACGVRIDTARQWLRRDAGMPGTVVDLDFCSAGCLDAWAVATGVG